jgi:hypothetical protein
MNSPIIPAKEWEKPNRSGRFVKIVMILMITSLIIFGLFLARGQGWITLPF